MTRKDVQNMFKYGMGVGCDRCCDTSLTLFVEAGHVDMIQLEASGIVAQRGKSTLRKGFHKRLWRSVCHAAQVLQGPDKCFTRKRSTECSTHRPSGTGDAGLYVLRF